MATLETARDGRVLRLAMNRPERRNALNSELCLELAAALDEAQRDDGAGAILLTGNGKCFCAGMDLAEVGAGGSETLDEAQERLFTAGARLTKPLVAAVRGAALGGGTGLAANCHIVIAGEDASFGLTEIRLGLWPFLVFRAVAAALGERRTVEMALTGRILGAAEAKEIGLAQEVAVNPEERAGEVAAMVAAYSPVALRSGMFFVGESRTLDWKLAGELARRMRHDIFETPDFQEGVRAFREKRAPKWPSLE